jgi:hypothetical protein
MPAEAPPAAGAVAGPTTELPHSDKHHPQQMHLQRQQPASRALTVGDNSICYSSKRGGGHRTACAVGDTTSSSTRTIGFHQQEHKRCERPPSVQTCAGSNQCRQGIITRTCLAVHTTHGHTMSDCVTQRRSRAYTAQPSRGQQAHKHTANVDAPATSLTTRTMLHKHAPCIACIQVLHQAT